jgi:hypothetical protein
VIFDDVISNNVMVDNAFTLTHEEIYTYLKKDSKRGMKATEIFIAL